MRSNKLTTPSNPTTSSQYEFDAAISFAGEDRSHAHSLAKALRARGFKVFYDSDYLHQLWGRNVSAWEQIYGPRSRYVIPLVSEHYVRKDWTRFEFESARKELKNRDYDFILPIRIDGTRLFGLKEDTTYLSFNDRPVKEIAAIFRKMCEPAAVAAYEAPKPIRRKARPVAILDRPSRLALGLIATCGIPLTFEHYQRLFPDLGWSSIIPRLRRRGLITQKHHLLKASQEAKRVISNDKEELEALKTRWIETLEPLRYYKDLAPHLSFHYLQARRFDDAVILVSEVVSGGDTGPWNDLYVSLLQQFIKPRIRGLLKTESRLAARNALGIALSEARSFRESLAVFKTLMREARRSRKGYWLGQAYINSGVTHFRRGDTDQAERCYSKALQIGKTNKDYRLAGRAAGNLAETIRPSAPERSRDLLDESIRLKRLASDDEGLITALLQRGNAYASDGDFSKAQESFKVGLRKCRAAGYEHQEALLLHNLGRCSSDMGRFAQAVNYFGQSYALATELYDAETQLIAAVGGGTASFTLKRYEDAQGTYEKLLAVATKLEDTEHILCALHGIGVVAILRGNLRLGKQSLQKAVSLARARKDEHWLSRCMEALSRPFDETFGNTIDDRKLTAAASNESARRSFNVGAELWSQVAELRICHGRSERLVLEAYENALRSSNCEPTTPLRIWKAYSELFGWHWNAGQFEQALETLGQAAQFTAKAKLRRELAQCLDQHGICLQDLGRLDEALPLHRRALVLSRILRDPELQENSLNNLGEALRKLGRHQEAAKILLQAEQLAARHGNAELAISVAHNRALVLEDIPRFAEARKLLQRCRDRARALKLWFEYVRALEALANLSTRQSSLVQARRLYQQAIVIARKHDVTEELPRLILNFSRFLMWQGESRKAIRLFKDIESEIKRSPDAQAYYLTQGQLYSEVGNHRLAARAFELGRAHALRIGDAENASDLSVHLAESLETLKKFAQSRNEINRALSTASSPQVRVSLLVQRLRVELEIRSEKTAEKTFAEARALALEHSFQQNLVDLHMILADHQWRGNAKARSDAVKAYFVAMAHALEAASADGLNDPESIRGYIGAGMHIARKITASWRSVTLQKLASLIIETEEWLAGQENTEMRILLWPLRLAEKLLPVANSPQRLSAKLEQMLDNGDLFAIALNSKPQKRCS